MWRTTASARPGSTPCPPTARRQRGRPLLVKLASRGRVGRVIGYDEGGHAEALADLLRARGDVGDVRWPGLGTVVCFDVGSPERAQAFLTACELVAEATSFGGVHTSAERRARWGTDAVPGGFIRLSAGVEDIGDLAADLTRALDVAG